MNLIKQIFDAHVRRISLSMGLVTSTSHISDWPPEHRTPNG